MTVEPGQTLLYYTLTEKLDEGGLARADGLLVDHQVQRTAALVDLPRVTAESTANSGAAGAFAFHDVTELATGRTEARR